MMVRAFAPIVSLRQRLAARRQSQKVAGFPRSARARLAEARMARPRSDLATGLRSPEVISSGLVSQRTSEPADDGGAAARLRRVRDRLGLSQREMAAELD